MLRSGSATDVGRVRTSNQDVALEDADLYAVADGMGGHVGGEVAARVAVDALRLAFQRNPTVEGLRQAVAEANRAVWRQSQLDTALRGMGTTMTATALVRATDGSNVVALANVGDSRAYVYSGGEVLQVTSDHSLAEEKVRQGELTEAEAAVHPHRHILTRALGVASDVDVDLWELRLEAGDRLLLCSDGLTNEVSDADIGAVLGEVEDPDEAARTLVQAALEHGGNDNVTVVVVDVVDGADAPPPAVSSDTPVANSGGGFGGLMGSSVAMSQGVSGHPGRERMGDASGGGVTTTTGGVKASLPLVGGPSAAGPAVRGVGAGRPPAAGSDVPLTRRDRRLARRRAGIPRLVTIRVVAFLVLLVAVGGAGYWLVRWYAMDDWYVGVNHGHLAVYHGRPGGFLWYKPKLAFESPVTTTEILPYRLHAVQGDKQETSYSSALSYIANLHAEFVATQQLGAGGTPNTTTTTTTAPAAT